MIEAITFDFWDTLAIDDSDEVRRRALGLPSKAEARTQLFAEFVTRRHPQVTVAAARDAWQVANDRFRQEWHTQFRTPAVSTRVSYALECMGLLPPPGQYGSLLAEIDELVREIELMEVRIPPTFAPGVETALYLLAQEYRLGIISDTIHTHGRGLRHLLGAQGLLGYFSATVFSDEVGASKPSAAVFRAAATQLDVPPARIAHVGDRESNDIEGPQRVGMRTILFTGIIDRSNGRTRADIVCRHLSDLPELVRRLR
ncbi:MAG: HAD family hydrolase [Caldilineaceae bacterium]